MTKIFLLSFLTLIGQEAISQTGKYFAASGEKCKSSKVFIDHRIQQYSGTEFTIDWSGTCKDGFADGNGTLTIILKKANYSFNMMYEGILVKGKKEGKGVLSLYLFAAGMAPYYQYSGSFKNDEFDGYGEFRSDYPYPIDPADIGKGLSMESLDLGSPIWRSDLFFYQYKGNFTAGKIGDTDNATGRTKKMPWLGKLVEYTGSVMFGRPNGKGMAKEVSIIAVIFGQFWASAEGNFRNGRLHGYGKEVGRYFVYQGEFVNGLSEGKGKLTVYRHGSFDEIEKAGGNIVSYILDGDFKNGELEGFTTVYFQNSTAYKYTGPLKHGNLDGTGEIEYLDGAKLRGKFIEGKMEGEGAITFANGDKFTGIYSNDKPVKGTLYYYNGSKYEGSMSIREEKNKITGKPVQVYIRQGKGTMTDKDGRTYAVNCENNTCTETY